jgi:hypothetical protein
LHVAGSIRADGVIYSESDSTYNPATELRTWGINKPYVAGANNDLYIEWGANAADGGAMYITDHWNYVRPLYVRTGPIHLMAGNTYGLFVNTNGNVGIGTTNPTATLTISSTNPAGAINIINTTTGASLLFVNATTGNVGIGTTAPEAKLNIPYQGSGNTIMIGSLANTGGNSFELTISMPSGATHWPFGITLGGTRVAAFDAGGNLRVDATGSSYFMGNLGVGTTSPAYKLDVRGGISWGGSAQNLLTEDQGGSIELGGRNDLANPVTGGAPYIDFHYGTGSTQDYNFRIINSADNRLDFASAGQGTFVSFNAGNVGIGTTSPAYKLDVAGTMRVIGGDGISYRWQNSNDDDFFGVGMWNSTTDRLEWYYYNGSSYAWATMTHCVNHDLTNPRLTIGGYCTGNNYNLYVSGTGRFTSDVHIDGNVGIGTTSPGAKLHIQGGKLYVDPNNFGGTAVISLAVGDTDTGLNSAGDGKLDIYSNNVNTMSIRSGNVGIGTTSPASKLDVRGITQITDDGATPDTSAYASFGVTRANVATNNAYIGLTKQGVVPWGIGIDSGSSLIFGVASASPARTIPTPLVTITTGGNVGIGTTSPNGKLEIAEDGVLSATDGNLVIQHPTSGSYSSIVFPSRVNYGSDYGYIAYYDDLNTYAYWGDSSENSALVIGTQNDGQNSVSDVVVLTSPAAVIVDSPSLILHSNRGGTGTQRIEGLRIFYAGDETQVSSTSTTPELKKQFTSVFDSSYGIKPRYINVIARIWNSAAGNTTYLNVTLEGCNGITLPATSTTQTKVTGSIPVASCGDGFYSTKIYLYTTSGGTAYNDLIEFYYVE